jgi:alkylated DNA repair dioxygenase AlkB
MVGSPAQDVGDPKLVVLTNEAIFARIEHMFRQASLFGSDEPCFDPSFSSASRSALSGSSWIEYVPGWLSGADSLFDDLMDRLDFTQRTGVPMYDRLVDEPRLTSWWSEAESDEIALPVLADARWALADRYDRHFDSIGFNLYRDRNDSVAWHADRHRHHVTDPVVAILSVGESRPFQMRRKRDPEHGEVGGASLTWGLGHGDLLVMGGACQHEWQHCVPKRRRPTGPRLSITFRHHAR